VKLQHLVHGLSIGTIYSRNTLLQSLTVAAWEPMHTTEHVRTDVGRAPPLVFQQVSLTHEMLPKAEVGDGYAMGPGNGSRM
jgi:hypothetical protein